MFNKVLLPEPDEPMMLTTSPRAMCRSIPFNTCSTLLPMW